MLDERLNGRVPGGVHALVGGPGTGKTIAALQFVQEAIRTGGWSALLTQARPDDIIELASSIGIELEEAIRAERCLLLGYQSGFRERYRRTIEPEEVFGELEAFLIQRGAPDRLAIDTCGPLVESRDSGNGAELLISLLEHLGSTSLLTFAGEHPGVLGSGFDFISQRASLMLHLTLNESGRRAMVVRKSPGPVKPPGPISFNIEDGQGIVAPPVHHQRSSDVSPDVRKRVLVVDVPGELPPEMRQWLSESFELVFTTDPIEAFPELARREFGVVAVHVDRRTVERGLHVMHQMRRAAHRPPILVMSPVDVRASDRVQALRAGADDFMSGGLNPDEVASRIEALLRRGRAETEHSTELEAPRKASNDESSRTDADELHAYVRSQLEAAKPPIFSLVILKPGNGRGVDDLADHVTERMRRDTGDRVSVVGNRVEVYLHGAMASHAERFLNRIRTTPFKKVKVEVYTAPTDRDRLLNVVGGDG